MTQTILTFITRVKPGRADSLGLLLNQIGENPETNTYVPFRSLQRLHFASFVLHESNDYGPYLVFENNFDGSLDDYLAELYACAAGGLHHIYDCCQDYSVKAASDRQGMLDYLIAHVVRPNAYHIGNTGRSVQLIYKDQDLRTELASQADLLGQTGKTTSVEAALTRLQQVIRSDKRWSWITSVGPRETLKQKAVAWSKLVAVVSLTLVLIPIWLIPVFVGLLVLRYKESTDSVQSDSADSTNVHKLLAKENCTTSVQNHMASITIVKPGSLRRVTLWIVLWFINLLARARATHGELSGIPSIHFAHWSLIDKGRRLLFVSNFDGSWENYLDDFIDKASAGLTGVWSNTVDFPRTYFLVFKGASDGPRFKAVARDRQTVTNAWYSAYGDQTVRNIDNSSSIREQLMESFDAAKTPALLRRI